MAVAPPVVVALAVLPQSVPVTVAVVVAVGHLVPSASHHRFLVVVVAETVPQVILMPAPKKASPQ